MPGGIPQYETLLMQSSSFSDRATMTLGRPGLIVGVQLTASISDSLVAPANAMARAFVTLNSFQTSAPASGDGAVLAMLVIPIVAAAALAPRTVSQFIFVPLNCPIRTQDKLYVGWDDTAPVTVSLQLASAIIHFQYG